MHGMENRNRSLWWGSALSSCVFDFDFVLIAKTMDVRMSALQTEHITRNRQNTRLRHNRHPPLALVGSNRPSARYLPCTAFMREVPRSHSMLSKLWNWIVVVTWSHGRYPACVHGLQVERPLRRNSSSSSRAQLHRETDERWSFLWFRANELLLKEVWIP
jgi:hypothetical protein